jgi:hypothetical protein
VGDVECGCTMGLPSPVHSCGGHVVPLLGGGRSLVSFESRDDGIDLVRLIGIGAIVAGHVWSGEVVERVLYTWHLPLS